MQKPPSTQTLSDSPDGPSPIYTVTQLTAEIKTLIEKRFPFVWIQGEISNLRRPPSGHLYFTLKDNASQISAVIFRGQHQHLKFEPEDGLAVIGLGRVSVYEPRGSYQIILEHVDPAGRGALQVAFEQLKTRLAHAGYFDEDRKQAIPGLPSHISLITSPGGAVVHDMLKVINRRFPSVMVDIVAASVQGDKAIAEIVAAIELVNRLNRSDAAILARGGGSLEDLQAFNSEPVAMAIAGSRIPIVSAVGHETDFTIADFVADLRAPTPSAAIEMILPDRQELKQRLAMLTANLKNNISHYYNMLSNKYKSVSERIIHPRKQIQELWLHLDDTTARLARCMHRFWQLQSRHLAWYDQRLQSNTLKFQFENFKQKYKELNNNLLKTFILNLSIYQKNLGELNARLSALNPMAVLDRGYSITRKLPERSVLTSASQVQTGQSVEIVLARGQLLCQVEGKTDHGQKNL